MELLRIEAKLKTPVGTVKGPGETLHEYTFIAPDPERQLKNGEFVYYLARRRWLLADTAQRLESQ